MEGKIIFKGIVGSQAYGTNTPESDVDIKGVYIQAIDKVAGLSYLPQVEAGKDECYFEVRRFLELCMTANPTMLELLFLPEECILESTEEWEYIKASRDLFVTKACRNFFGDYAVAQIQKAKGLDKKMNWEKEQMVAKGIIDFCYISDSGKSMPLVKYLERENIDQQFVGMVKLDHMADCYVMYHDAVAQWGKEGNHRFKGKDLKVPTLGFKGISSEDGNHLLLSSVPKYTIPKEGVVYFNKSEYAKHRADYNSYTTWLKERNTARYVDSQKHGQMIDGKNLLHCRRLLDMAKEIASTGKVQVRRPNKDYLVSIRKGEVKLDDIIAKASEDVKLLDEAFDKSSLPENVDKQLVEGIITKVRGLC